MVLEIQNELQFILVENNSKDLTKYEAIGLIISAQHVTCQMATFQSGTCTVKIAKLMMQNQRRFIVSMLQWIFS